MIAAKVEIDPTFRVISREELFTGSYLQYRWYRQYDLTPDGRRFVMIMNPERGVLEVVRPPVSSPTHAPDLAAALLELLEVRASGIVHLANLGGCSRLELATEAVRLAGLADRVEIRERPEPTGGAARPAYSVLDTSHYTRLTGKTPPPWSEALGHYIAEL